MESRVNHICLIITLIVKHNSINMISDVNRYQKCSSREDLRQCGFIIIVHFEGLLIINHYEASTVFLELNLFIYVYMLCVCAKSL